MLKTFLISKEMLQNVFLCVYFLVDILLSRKYINHPKIKFMCNHVHLQESSTFVILKKI